MKSLLFCQESSGISNDDLKLTDGRPYSILFPLIFCYSKMHVYTHPHTHSKFTPSIEITASIIPSSWLEVHILASDIQAERRPSFTLLIHSRLEYKICSRFILLLWDRNSKMMKMIFVASSLWFYKWANLLMLYKVVWTYYIQSEQQNSYPLWRKLSTKQLATSVFDFV